MTITLESGLSGEVRQDLHTWPAQKKAVATFENGSVTWLMGDSSDHVSLSSADGKKIESWDFPKTRPDDFFGEISHLEDLLAHPASASSLDLEHGIAVMEVALAAMASSASGVSANVESLRDSA